MAVSLIQSLLKALLAVDGHTAALMTPHCLALPFAKPIHRMSIPHVKAFIHAFVVLDILAGHYNINFH